MQLSPVPPDIARAGLRALMTVARADGEIHDLERGLIESVRVRLLRIDEAIDDLPPIEGEELARIIAPREFRERVARGVLMVALMDAEASEAERDVIADYTRALGVDPAPFADFERILNESFVRLRIDVVRRSFIGKRLRQHVGKKGLTGFVQAIESLAKVENQALANRYRSLETYPAGTLGRAYADFVRKNEFAFPGEVGGAPEPIVFHDCVHVLTGYDVTPGDEVLAAAFQAGFANYDPFFSLLFVFAQFHLGIEISPIAGVEKLAIEPDAMIAALVRGTKCKVDMSDDWDPWDAFPKRVDDLRREYEIPPRG